MPTALGINAQLLGKSEATYGTPPAGNYGKLPFVSANLGKTQGLIANDAIGMGRDPLSPSRGPADVTGDVVVPVDVRNFGQWLTWLLGVPTTTGGGPYVHTFVSGAAAIPSFALEVGMTDRNVFLMQKGLRADSMRLDFQRSGNANATFSLIGQDEERAGATGGGAATVAEFTRFNMFQASISKDGVALGNVVSSNLTYANKLEKDEVIRDDGLIGGSQATLSEMTGSMTVRFSDTVLLALAESGTVCELEYAFTIDADTALVITVHEVHLPKPRQSIQGPGGIQATYDWQAAKDQALGKMATFVLKNDVASYS